MMRNPYTSHRFTNQKWTFLGCSFSGTRLGCSDSIFNCLVSLFRSSLTGLSYDDFLTPLIYNLLLFHILLLLFIFLPCWQRQAHSCLWIFLPLRLSISPATLSSLMSMLIFPLLPSSGILQIPDSYHNLPEPLKLQKKKKNLVFSFRETDSQ